MYNRSYLYINQVISCLRKKGHTVTYSKNPDSRVFVVDGKNHFLLINNYLNFRNTYKFDIRPSNQQTEPVDYIYFLFLLKKNKPVYRLEKKLLINGKTLVFYPQWIKKSYPLEFICYLDSQSTKEPIEITTIVKQKANKSVYKTQPRDKHGHFIKETSLKGGE